MNIIKWSKENLFKDKLSALITGLVATCLLIFGSAFFDWLVISSTWTGGPEACFEGAGACLPFIKEKARFIIFGVYPEAEHYRPLIFIIFFIFSFAILKERRRWVSRILIPLAVGFCCALLLMRGGALGIPLVETHLWGGLPLTLILATLGNLAAYPLGVILALGRQSHLPFIKGPCVVYIELIRGVPLIALLFMASVMFPLLMPGGVSIDKLIRAQIAIILFSAAYMAEVFRGGLQAMDSGQYEAADALGLNYFQKMRFVILPQALKIVIPPTLNTAIGLFKDTSLVVIIALFDLMSTTKAALKDTKWPDSSLEAYLFLACVYFVFTSSLGRVGKRWESELNEEQTRSS